MSTLLLYHIPAAQGLHRYSIAAPPTMAASPPATAQSGESMAAAAFLVAAVLAELEVAVLVLELVLDPVGCVALDEAAAEPTASPGPLLPLPPASPLPLEPTGDWGIA